MPKSLYKQHGQGQDPTQTEDVSADLLTAWNTIPIACGFRFSQRRVNGRKQEATATDKVAQQQAYAKCSQWASLCGLTETEFKDELEGVPSGRSQNQIQRGREGITACLQQKNATHWGHVKLKCVETAIHKAAEFAAKEMGSQELATKAGQEVSEWLSSENARLSRLATLPKQWRGIQGLNLPTNCYQYLGHVITIAWLLCLHSLPRRMDECIAHRSFA